MKSALIALAFCSCVLVTFTAGAAAGYISISGSEPPDRDTGESVELLSRPIAPIMPQPGAKLNYTQIMFEHPQVTGADEYLVEVALNNGNNPFASPLVRQNDSSTAIMISGLEFGKKYVWRYAAMHNHKLLTLNGPYNFEILNNALVDKKQYRVRVTQNDTAANAGGLIMLDMGRCIDRNGNFVWFFPPEPAGKGDPLPPPGPMAMGDLRLTPAGTLTLLNGTAEETDLAGRVLWKAPPAVNIATATAKTGPLTGYHHCFKKLLNGNYMAMTLNTFAVGDSTPGSDDKPTIAYETIKEFDRYGKLVWNWSSRNYFDSTELAMMLQHKPDLGLVNPQPGGHTNAFEADERNGFVYASLRNVSRVIKIDKKTGKVVCAWGDNMNYRGAKNGDGFFLKQHSVTLLHDGSLAVFNNNSYPEAAYINLPALGSKNVGQPPPSGGAVSGIVVFSQPTDTANSRIVWQYDCRFNDAPNLSARGGNVDELYNYNLLVGMGAVNRAFEITRTKRIVWNALIEKYEDYDTSWHAFPAYNVHYASSLYPCYFTVQTSTGKSNGTQIKIFNNGTEDDSYTVGVSTSSTGGIKKLISTGTVHPQKSVSVNCPPTGATITVTSNTNPGFSRVVE